MERHSRTFAVIRGHLETSADIGGHAAVTTRHKETGPTPQVDRAGGGCLYRPPPEDGQIFVAAFEGPGRYRNGRRGNAVAGDRLALQQESVSVVLTNVAAVDAETDFHLKPYPSQAPAAQPNVHLWPVW